MSEDKIILPDFVIADLFKNHLLEPQGDAKGFSKIVSSETRSQDNNASPSPLKFLGRNKKGITVVVNEQDAPFINDNDLAFLTKILNACSLNLEDIAILNVNRQPTNFEKLKSDLKAEFILLLGVKPTSIDLPFTMPDFQVQQFSNCTIISAPALSSLLEETPENKALKRHLWTSLQTAFKLTK